MMELKHSDDDIFYLACPYSHDDPAVCERRFKAVNRVAAQLIKQGLFIYSPVSHGYILAKTGDLPTGWSFWESFDRAMLSKCKCLLVLMLDGWKESVGVQAEIKIAGELELHIEYLDPTEFGLNE